MRFPQSANASTCATALARSKMALEGEVLGDGTKARGKSLRALGPANTSHASLAFTRGQMLFSARLFARAQAFTNRRRTFASAGISTFAAGWLRSLSVTILRDASGQRRARA